MKSFNQHKLNIAASLIAAFSLIAQASFGQVVAPSDNKPDNSSLPPMSVIYRGIHNLNSNGKFNYVRTILPDQPVQNLSGSFYRRQSTDYFDGLGRPLQTVVKKGHADGNDIVSVHVYDSLGRETYQYLPYAAPTGGYAYIGSGPGNIKLNDSSQLRGFYDNLGPDEQPFSKTVFEPSPLNRVISQMPPGRSWVGASRGTTYDYKTNSERSYYLGLISYKVTGSFPRFTIGNNMGEVPQYVGNYAEGELYITAVTDEDGNQSEEIKDKQGRVVMKRILYQKLITPPAPTLAAAEMFPTNYNYTIYVYDDLGRLRVVLTPEVCKPSMTYSISGNYRIFTYTWSVNTDQLSGLCYQYFYDKRSRLTEKKIPGKAVEYYIYDKRDRQIFYQDANLRIDNKWFVNFYDAQDRLTGTGITLVGEAPMTRSEIQNWVDGLNNPSPNEGLAYYIGNYSIYHQPPDNLGTYCTMLTLTYYDDYDQGDLSSYNFDHNQFVGVELPSNNNTVVPPPADAYQFPLGMPTGTKVKVIDPDDPSTDTWLTTINYYDDKGRVIQTQSQTLKGTFDISSNIYYFQGMLYKNILKHQNQDALTIDGATDVPITTYKLINSFDRNLSYTGGNDLVWMHKQKINGGVDYSLAAYDYDHLGRIVLKQFTAGANFEDYTMRGFLNDIIFNNFYSDTLFQERLFYDKGFARKLYNGNIAGIIWAGQDGEKKAYGYTYDMMNRLTHAEFSKWMPAGSGGSITPYWGKATMDYTVSNLTYDLNGNIKSMDQQVKAPGYGTPTPGPMDQLTYTYAANTNLLIKVEDAVPATNTAALSLPDFKDGAHNAQEYTYDSCGNMITDDNKHISAITYNYLNKPERITVDGKGEISYTYDALGNRLRKRVMDYNTSGNGTVGSLPLPSTEVWDYMGGFVYKDNQLQYILNDEGRARPIPATGNLVPANSETPNPTIFVYDYFVKDHLGNVRSTVTATPNSQNYAARHEIASANIEELIFDNIPLVREDKPGSTTLDDKYAARLNGGEANRQVGTAIMLNVRAGDKLSFSVKSFYEGEYVKKDDIGTSTLVESLMSTLLRGQNYSGVPLSELPENAQLVEGIFSNPELASEISSVINDVNDPNAPNAHLNYLWFNDDLQLDKNYSGSYQVPVNANGIGSWATLGGGQSPSTGTSGGGTMITPWDGGQFIAPASGILVVYIDNQSIGQDVWFDDLFVNNYESEVLEEDHYYPYGLCLNTTPMQTGVNQQHNKYNGIELEKHFGLEMNEAFYRIDDPQLGRFWQIDPKYAFGLSPYSSRANNPVLVSDPLGDTTQIYGKNGVLFATINDNLENQVHFMGFEYKGQALDLSGKNPNAMAKVMRSLSVAFIGKNSIQSLEEIADKSAKTDQPAPGYVPESGKEIGFYAEVSKSREIIFKELPVPTDYQNSYDWNARRFPIGGAMKFLTAQGGDPSKLFGTGHTHTSGWMWNFGANVSTQQMYGTGVKALQYYGNPTNPDDYRIITGTNNVMFIASPVGITVYSPNRRYLNSPNGSVVEPSKYLYKWFKSGKK